VGKYRKKPVIIEARQIVSYLDLEPIAEWIVANGGKAVAGQNDKGPAYMLINTLEGTMEGRISDYIIRGVQGEFYPCKGKIFNATYEAVSDGQE
jgi:hypothetical protein